jgi:hypothetical protein
MASNLSILQLDPQGHTTCIGIAKKQVNNAGTRLERNTETKRSDYLRLTTSMERDGSRRSCSWSPGCSFAREITNANVIRKFSNGWT